jgi:hypothetical protein
MALFSSSTCIIIFSFGKRKSKKSKNKRSQTNESQEPIQSEGGRRVMCAVVEGRDAVVFPVGMTLFKVLLPARIQSSNGLEALQREKQQDKNMPTYG